MQLKVRLLIAFVLNVACLGVRKDPSSLVELFANVPPMRMNESVESLKKDPSSFVELLAGANPDVINQVIGLLETLVSEADSTLTTLTDRVTETSNSFDTANTELLAAQDTLEAANTAKSDADNAKTAAEEKHQITKVAKEEAEKNYNDQSPNLYEEKRVLLEVIEKLRPLNVLVFRQTLPKLFVQGETRLNAEDSANANYAILDELESYRSDNGRFYFRLLWPGDSIMYEWSQTSNPVTENIRGYAGIKIPYTGRYWGGLEPSSHALMDGSVGHDNWFYAVGSYSLWDGGIPSYAKTEDDHRYPKQEVELYVYKHPGAEV